MAIRKVKEAPKMYESDPVKIKEKVLTTMKKIANIVGSTLGPSGRNCLIESDYPGIPNKNTKDGVTVFKSLGATDPYEHMIIEQARDVAQRTATEAGDGTTTATVLSQSLIENLFKFCEENPKYSPQKAVRKISKVTRDILIPYINERSIKVEENNKELLKMVAKVSANGDEDMANAVIKAFEEVGYGESSHVTIREANGPDGYSVERIDGFPIAKGYEESIGRMHSSFINDVGNQRSVLEKPKFILFDGKITDIISIIPLTSQCEELLKKGNNDYANIVLVAHGFSEAVLTALAMTFTADIGLKIIPLATPMAQFINSQLHFLQDLSAFTGAKIFGLQNQITEGTLEDLGSGMTSFECYRFRSTVIGDSDPLNIEVRADQLRAMKEAAESIAEGQWIEERLGKLTSGIAKLTIYGSSNADLKERHDRVEDSVMSTRATIAHGALPGGCRLAIDMAIKLSQSLEKGDPALEVLMPSLLSLPNRLLDNAGYNDEEKAEVITRLIKEPELVYDLENEKFGKAEELGLFDATKAVEQSLNNAVSIAGVLGTMGGLVAYKRDDVFERSEAALDNEFMRASDNPYQYKNEANERP